MYQQRTVPMDISTSQEEETSEDRSVSEESYSSNSTLSTSTSLAEQELENAIFLGEFEFSPHVTTAMIQVPERIFSFFVDIDIHTVGAIDDLTYENLANVDPNGQETIRRQKRQIQEQELCKDFKRMKFEDDDNNDNMVL